MSKIKVGEDGVNRRIEMVAERRRRISDLQEMGRVREYPEWQKLGKILQGAADVQDRTIALLANTTASYEAEDFHKRVLAAVTKRDTLLGITNLVKDPATEVQRLEDEITALEAEIKEAASWGPMEAAR
jgi:hypothetical protein